MPRPLHRPTRIEAFRSKARPGELAAAAIALIVPAAYYFVKLGRLFPLVEYRSWLDYPSIGLARLIRVMLVRDELFSRWLSLEFVKSMRGICGIDVECLDGVSYVPVGLACVLLYAFARQIGLARAIASGVTILWALSAPVADAMSWQATSHDRLAALFAFAVLNVAYYQVGKPWSPKRVVGTNAALFALIVLAYNSKESAFFLGPALAVLPFARTQRWDRRTLFEASTPIVAPLAYAVFHNVRYAQLLASDPVWQGHTGGGDPVYNAVTLAPFLVNQDDWSAVTVVAFALLAIAVAALAIRYSSHVRSARAGGDPSASVAARTVLWLWFAFFVAASAALRTRFASTYYLMLPAALFYLAGARALVSVCRLLPEKLGWGGAALLGILCSAAWLTGFARTNTTLGAESAHSDEFLASFSTLRRYIPPSHQGPVYLVTDDARPDAYRFVGQRDQRDLYKYVYRSEQPNHAFEQQLFDMKTSVWRRLGRRDEKALYVVFDDSMRLVRIDVGSRPWFTRDAPPSPARAARAPE
ncbi:MAG TPA: hypothetical protein VHC69_03260 [Polyangiaceae bacterium]|nr:hypothetical protein [Polyangiaceae bacterium]